MMRKGREALLEKASGSARNAILLTQYGGLEIASATERILGQGAFDVAEAHRLGDAVSGREKNVQFSIFNRGLLGLLESRTISAARQGDIESANHLCEMWAQTNDAVRDAEIYNLDRKQHVIGTLAAIRESMQGLPDLT